MNKLVNYLSDLKTYNINNSENKPLLICFHHGGGGASSFKGWYQELHSMVNIAIIQLPGREGRLNEPFYTKVEDVITDLLNEVENFGCKTIILFGYCMGGLIAYEFSHALKCLGEKAPHVLALIVAAAAEPNYCELHKLNKPLSDTELGMIMSQRFEAKYNVPCDEEYLKMILPILNADRSISMNYKYMPRDALNIPIHMVGGCYDDITVEALAAWKMHTTQNFSLKLFNGGHMFIEQCEQELLCHIKGILNLYSKQSYKDGE